MAFICTTQLIKTTSHGSVISTENSLFQLRSPNELYTVLRTVQDSGRDKQQQQQQQQQSNSDDSPAPAGRSLRPKGLQSISEVLLTGASGIVGAEQIDLTSTRARPTESVLVAHGGQSTGVR